ncbi:MAG TPA: hypothetical protein VKH35_14130 [Thermoanaerobaculia bacterium]|nr:hypothetical protein [Thermoanaerobaculia bacterium]
MPKRVAAIGLLILASAAAVGPIRSYDFFWQIATGRWILQHHALPIVDPFALASAHVPWINGEWLWQAAAFAVTSLVGFPAVSVINGVFVGAIFALTFWSATRESDFGVTAFVTAVAFAGGSGRLGIRPAEGAALLIVVALALLASRLDATRLAIAYAVLTVVWINTHPSALLAPALAAATLWIDLGRWKVAAASALALLVNPYGWHAIASPLALTRLVTSGAFVNAEWLPSAPARFPLLYITLAAVVIAFLIVPDKRQHVWRVLVFALLGALAVRHVRDQGLYFAALPILFPPVRPLGRSASFALALCALVPLGWTFARSGHGTGVDPAYFPIRAVERLQATGLQGNIYNADQFGGYLEWVFYPQRRVLTDGRNELFSAFIAQDARARTDSRVWHALLRQYRIDLAVDEYQRAPIEILDAATGQRRRLPASLVRYPRRDWALIAFDGTAMVFARRAAYPAERIAVIEIRDVVPDAPR